MSLVDELRRESGINGDTDIRWKAADEIERIISLDNRILAEQKAKIEADAKVIAALREALEKVLKSADAGGIAAQGAIPKIYIEMVEQDMGMASDEQKAGKTEP